MFSTIESIRVDRRETELFGCPLLLVPVERVIPGGSLDAKTAAGISIDRSSFCFCFYPRRRRFINRPHKLFVALR